jgi:23S rRNA (uracil1939-C5)-methyltransferase
MIDKDFGCPVAKKCGGCQLTNMSYPQQLSFKQAKVIKLMGRFCHVDEIIGMDNPYHYRNKVQAAFGVTRGGQIISGVYQSGSHRIVKVDDCLIEDKTADEIIVFIRSLVKSFKLSVYNENTGRGFLRHVLVKHAFGTDEVMVVLVTGNEPFKSKNDFIKTLLKKFPIITTVVQSINDRFTSLVLGNTENILYGNGYITDELLGKKFRISARSFYQINYVGTQSLYSKALEFADLKGNERVIDAYSGVGTIGILASDKAGEVISVELNKDAVRDAKKNAAINGINNISFYCADAAEFLEGMASEGENVDVVIMDPPRAGSTPVFLKSIVSAKAKKIVYVSCSPDTLARDVTYLTRNGYAVKKIQPVDMFPHTSHVETVVQLVRKKPDTVLDVRIDLSELDVTPAETEATYQEIKAYIFEQHGVKVSSLYIAQVKEKHGLRERENYNKAKSEDSKQPHCPAEKEKLIEEALRHFQMID